MLPLTKEQEVALGAELAAKRQEHADLDAAITTLVASRLADQMLIQRMKKRKLGIKDRIVQLENLLIRVNEEPTGMAVGVVGLFYDAYDRNLKLSKRLRDIRSKRE